MCGILFLACEDAGIRVRMVIGGVATRGRLAKRGGLLSVIDSALDGVLPGGIAVRVGVGRFSDTRAAIATANALSFAWNMPVIAIPVGYNGWKKMEELIVRSKKRYAAAAYSGAPHITRKQQLNTFSVQS